MRKAILLIILACALLSFLACDNCRYQDCLPNGGYVALRYVRDGKNAIFGPDAFIDRDLIKYYSGGFSDSPSAFSYFDEETETIVVFIEDIYGYNIKLGSVRTDTLEGITSVIDYDHCCAEYELKYVYINGEIVCFEDCGEVVEVEI